MSTNCCHDDGCDLARRMLRAGVPLTLLLDLVAPAGPDSRSIALAEGGRRSSP